MNVLSGVDSSFFRAFQKRYNVEVLRMLRAREIVERGEIHPLPNGNYAVRSHTPKAPAEYQVNPRYEECNCYDARPQFVNGELVKEAQVCKHYISYLLVRELGFNRARQAAIESQQPRIALLQIEYNSITAREAKRRIERDARPRTEWHEEI